MRRTDCTDCQKWAGALYAGWSQLVRAMLTYMKSHSAHLLLKSDVIEHHGPEPKRMTIKADSGRDMERAWCNDCGSGIWITIVGSDMTNLKAGTNWGLFMWTDED